MSINNIGLYFGSNDCAEASMVMPHGEAGDNYGRTVFTMTLSVDDGGGEPGPFGDPHFFIGSSLYDWKQVWRFGPV